MKHTSLKDLLSRVGGRLSDRAVHNLNGVFNYLYIGWWFKSRNFTVSTRFADRPQFYAHLAKGLTEPVQYLEFGVFRGASMRNWSKLLQNPETRLDGFDSFEGLPEEWRMAADKSTFDVTGELPRIDDSRVKFHKGWFEDTLSPFLETFDSSSPLVVHLDADLYSSTRFVLETLCDLLVPGTLLIFDELFDRGHELKAFEEFLEKTGCQLECVGATKGLTQAAFRILEPARSAGR